MKTGTATIDINEYDRMMEVIRTSNEEYNSVCEVIYKFCIEAAANHHDTEIIRIMTNAGYTIKMNTSTGLVDFGKGPKIIKIGMK